MTNYPPPWDFRRPTDFQPRSDPTLLFITPPSNFPTIDTNSSPVPYPPTYFPHHLPVLSPDSYSSERSANLDIPALLGSDNFSEIGFVDYQHVEEPSGLSASDLALMDGTFTSPSMEPFSSHSNSHQTFGVSFQPKTLTRPSSIHRPSQSPSSPPSDPAQDYVLGKQLSYSDLRVDPEFISSIPSSLPPALNTISVLNLPVHSDIGSISDNASTGGYSSFSPQQHTDLFNQTGFTLSAGISSVTTSFEPVSYSNSAKSDRGVSLFTDDVALDFDQPSRPFSPGSDLSKAATFFSTPGYHNVYSTPLPPTTFPDNFFTKQAAFEPATKQLTPRRRSLDSTLIPPSKEAPKPTNSQDSDASLSLRNALDKPARKLIHSSSSENLGSPSNSARSSNGRSLPFISSFGSPSLGGQNDPKFHDMVRLTRPMSQTKPADISSPKSKLDQMSHTGGHDMDIFDGSFFHPASTSLTPQIQPSRMTSPSTMSVQSAAPEFPSQIKTSSSKRLVTLDFAPFEDMVPDQEIHPTYVIDEPTNDQIYSASSLMKLTPRHSISFIPSPRNFDSSSPRPQQTDTTNINRDSYGYNSAQAQTQPPHPIAPSFTGTQQPPQVPHFTIEQLSQQAGSKLSKAEKTSQNRWDSSKTSNNHHSQQSEQTMGWGRSDRSITNSGRDSEYGMPQNALKPQPGRGNGVTRKRHDPNSSGMAGIHSGPPQNGSTRAPSLNLPLPSSISYAPFQLSPASLAQSGSVAQPRQIVFQVHATPESQISIQTSPIVHSPTPESAQRERKAAPSAKLEDIVHTITHSAESTSLVIFVEVSFHHTAGFVDLDE
ncbi:hypothetical protein BLNAU_11647 [Blattamonas nauphoetae]|uniref:Uncharacterized protein n=1 Tax=Blattamonas nauphoetae TaxID=2049346 RepID=A0ABQ9XLS1_9EUKA|nr:hypothetical protein BLNAU_11647 [Blattamonas nauphoetae]